jgi:hypothetical protein
MKPAEKSLNDRIFFLKVWLIPGVKPSFTLLFQRIMNIDNNAIIISGLIILCIQLKSREFLSWFTGGNAF